MAQSTNEEHQFVVELLTTLREERFSPSGWGHFLQRSWQMSCATANANPELKRSWLSTTLLIGLLTAALLLMTDIFEGSHAAFHLLPGLVFCVAWQQNDLFWHLGMNRHGPTGKLRQKIGLANILTGWRGLGASFLLGRLIGGLTTPSWLTLTVLLTGIVTDILDGQVARYAGTQSKLGQIIDAETDFCLYLAITIILIQNNTLAPWIGIVMLLRFCLPFLAALGSYFLFAQPVRFGSTIWGKSAGFAQCLYFLILLAPPQLAMLTRPINFPLLMITLVLLIIAPLAQIMPHIRHRL